MAQCPSPKAVCHARGMSFYYHQSLDFAFQCQPVRMQFGQFGSPWRRQRENVLRKQHEMCLHVLSHSKLKRQEIFGKNSSIFTHHLPHTPDSLYLFLFYLFIFHFNTKQQLFMFFECSINMQKKNLKLINRIIIICLSQNELLSYIYISLYQPRWAMSALDGTTTTHRRPCDKGGCSVSPPPPCFSLISCEGAKKHSVEIAMATGVRGAGLYWPITHLRPVAYCFSNIHFNSRHPAQSGIWLKSEFASHWSYCWFSAYLLSFLKHV